MAQQSPTIHNSNFLALLSHILTFAQYMFYEMKWGSCQSPSLQCKIFSDMVSCVCSMEITSRTYTLSIERHDDGYLAFFPALPGCHTWGRTFEEAVKHAEEALTVYLETFDELGKTIPEEKHIDELVSLGVTVRVPVIA